MGERAKVVVIGGGIVGLATADAVLSDGAADVVVLEKEQAYALHQTGRNSGVLHSGLYYRPGSLKAELAVRGRASLVEFCRAHGVKHEVCGKVVVATSATEDERLRALEARAAANGVRARRITVAELAELEPHVAGTAAIHVPETGIVDFRAVCDVLVGRIRRQGGSVQLGTKAVEVIRSSGGAVVATDVGEIAAQVVVNCGGLQADLLAGPAASRAGIRIVPFRGEYYELVESRSYLVRNLVYPVPHPAFPFLGVHFTRGIDGSVHAGPNAVLALAREGYSWRDVRMGELARSLGWPGTVRLARRHWKSGMGEVVRSLSKRAFVRALQRLVPDIVADDLRPAPSGVRAQALARDGSLVDDFSVVESRYVIHVLNAPSPAATASLEIGRYLAAKVADRLR